MEMSPHYYFSTENTFDSTHHSNVELKNITKNFNNKLGDGGFGSVFRGTLPLGSEDVVKYLDGFDPTNKSFVVDVETALAKSTAGLVGELLFSGFNVVGFNWISSPAATELESVVLDWMGKLLKLQSSFRHDLADLMYHIRSDIAMAKLVEAFVRKDERFEIVVQRKFALVCFMLKPKAEDGGELNFKLVEVINSSGRAL
ncbi:hypothetical protein GQ457_05G033580 [Hibiscus cannabinus]